MMFMIDVRRFEICANNYRCLQYMDGTRFFRHFTGVSIVSSCLASVWQGFLPTVGKSVLEYEPISDERVVVRENTG